MLTLLNQCDPELALAKDVRVQLAAPESRPRDWTFPTGRCGDVADAKLFALCNRHAVQSQCYVSPAPSVDDECRVHCGRFLADLNAELQLRVWLCQQVRVVSAAVAFAGETLSHSFKSDG